MTDRAATKTAQGRGACVSVECAGEEFVLSSMRVAWWPRERVLLVADIHLGKADAMRWRGAPVPESVTRGLMVEPLERLAAAVRGFDAARVLILGDLLHDPVGVTPEVVEAVASWRRATADARVDLIRGNHDRKVEALAEYWGMTLHPGGMTWGPFRFVHDPAEETASEGPGGGGVFVWAGHIHPAVRLRRGGDTLKVPCFRVSPGGAVLPAFSRFTGGIPVDPSPADRLFACVEDAIFAVGG